MEPSWSTLSEEKLLSVQTSPSALPPLFASSLVCAKSSSGCSDHHDWLDVPDGLSSHEQECAAAMWLPWAAGEWALLLPSPTEAEEPLPGEFPHDSAQESPGAPLRGFLP